jgi:hypothetical protein
MPNYQRNIVELESKASFWWPTVLSELETGSSTLPLLLTSQPQFISILKLCKKDPLQIFELIKAAEFPGNLFLKHLVVLSDFGGEQIQRLNSQFSHIFKRNASNSYFFKFVWKEKEYTYNFKKLPIRGTLNNTKLQIDGPSLISALPLDDLKEDMVMILLFASTCDEESVAKKLSKCEVGTFLGENDVLDRYITEKYLWVSRITGGAQSNTLGQVAQTYAVDYLEKKLGKDYSVKRNSHLEIKKEKVPFDIVVSKGKKSVGIEVSFQVTTNSTIERKATNANSLQRLLHSAGHFIAYIIDGAGNFQRKSAFSKICNHSDCTVAFSDSEFDVLADFISKKL